MTSRNPTNQTTKASTFCSQSRQLPINLSNTTASRFRISNTQFLISLKTQNLSTIIKIFQLTTNQFSRKIEILTPISKTPLKTETHKTAFWVLLGRSKSQDTHLQIFREKSEPPNPQITLLRPNPINCTHEDRGSIQGALPKSEGRGVYN